MEIRRQHQPDGDRSLRETREQKVLQSSDGVRTSREERMDLAQQRTEAARTKQARIGQARQGGADQVEISDRARALAAAAESAHPDGPESLTDRLAEARRSAAKLKARMHLHRGGLAEAREADPAHAERLAELRSMHANGSLASPERVQRAAGRMLGEDA